MAPKLFRLNSVSTGKIHGLYSREAIISLIKEFELSNSLEGRIDIHLKQRDGLVSEVAVCSTRPRIAQKLMAGATPSEAANRAGLVFSLCGKAQRIAAEMACEAAQGLHADAETRVLRSRRVLIELAQEHAWNLLLNWPRQAGEQPDMSSLLGLRQAAADAQAFAEILQTLIQTVFLGETAARWLERDLTAFDIWREHAVTLPARLFRACCQANDKGITHAVLLPPLFRLDAAQCADLARRALTDEDFCTRPHWLDAPAETGAIARQQQHSLLQAWLSARGRGAGARMLARQLELAQLPQAIRDGDDKVVRAYTLAQNIGMSAIETSRGLLIHVVRLENGKVADYRIVAPTEWNFHPAGALIEALGNLPGGEDVGQRAQAICQSLDPCVAFAVEVAQA